MHVSAGRRHAAKRRRSSRRSSSHATRSRSGATRRSADSRHAREDSDGRRRMSSLSAYDSDHSSRWASRSGSDDDEDVHYTTNSDSSCGRRSRRASVSGSAASRSHSDSSCHSSHSSSSSSDSASSEQERQMRYPRFDHAYAERFRHELVPFLQAIAPSHAPATAAVDAAPCNNDNNNSDRDDGDVAHDTAQAQHVSDATAPTATLAHAPPPLPHPTTTTTTTTATATTMTTGWPTAQLRALRGTAPWAHTTRDDDDVSDGLGHHRRRRRGRCHELCDGGVVNNEASNRSAARCVDKDDSRRRGSDSNSSEEAAAGLRRTPSTSSHTPHVAAGARHTPSKAAATTATTTAAAATAAVAASSPCTLLLYGSYVYCGVLGKGTYSKVVLARRLQRGDTVAGGGTAATAMSSPSATSLVALKIFRDKTAYREACWDEVAVLRVLAQQVMTPETTTATTTTALAPVAAATTATGQERMLSERSNVAVAVRHVAHSGCYVGMLDYIPHPVHPAIVLPVMGPSLLRCLRAVRQASRTTVASAAMTTTLTSTADVVASRSGAPTALRATTAAMAAPVSRTRRWWRRGLPASLVKAVLYQILLFLQYSHQRGIVHTDLKPENVLFESNITLPTSVPVSCCDRPSRDGVCDNDDDDNNNNNNNGSCRRSNSSSKTRDRHQARHAHKSVAHAPSASRSGSADTAANASGNTDDARARPTRGEDATRAVWRHAHTVRVPLPLLNSVRVTDFGTAQLVHRFTHRSHVDGCTPVSYDAIQTTHYRSPEVLLGVGWSTSADIFSLGCMIPELLTGDCVFMPKDTLEHLALMEHVIGPFAAATTTTTTMTAATPSKSARTSGDAMQRDDTGNNNGGGQMTRCSVLQDVYACNTATLHHYFCAETGQLRWPYTAADRAAHERQRDRAHAERRSHRAHRSRTRSNSSSSTSARDDSSRHKSNNGSRTRSRSPRSGDERDDDEDDDSDSSLPPLHLTSARDVRFVRQKPTLQDILGDNPLLLDLTRRMLHYHPLQRITADEALQHPYFHTQTDLPAAHVS